MTTVLVDRTTWQLDGKSLLAFAVKGTWILVRFMIIYRHPCNPRMQRKSKNTTRLHTNFFRLFSAIAFWINRDKSTLLESSVISSQQILADFTEFISNMNRLQITDAMTRFAQPYQPSTPRIILKSSLPGEPGPVALESKCKDPSCAPAKRLGRDTTWAGKKWWNKKNKFGLQFGLHDSMTKLILRS